MSTIIHVWISVTYQEKKRGGEKSKNDSPFDKQIRKEDSCMLSSKKKIHRQEQQQEWSSPSIFGNV